MNIYFTFKKGTHLGMVFHQLQRIFPTVFIDRNTKEIGVDANDYEKNKNNFPSPLLTKIVRCRSGKVSLLEFLVNNWNPFDNKIELCESCNNQVVKQN
jgi:hypothetical protein